MFCTEFLIQLRCLKEDAALGIVFPLFFSIGVVLISRYARNVHLDIDMILLGELAFAPFNRFKIGSFDLGAQALWVSMITALFNILFIKIFFKELVISTFDKHLAYLFGFLPSVMYYALMIITSITAVAAFDIVGSIVVVALMITPPATAYLLSNDIKIMLWLSALIGCLSSLFGYLGAHVFDVSIAGSIATTTGLFFLLALLCAPQKGIIARIITFKRNQENTAQDLFCWYLYNYSSVETIKLAEEFGWNFIMNKSFICFFKCLLHEIYFF